MSIHFIAETLINVFFSHHDRSANITVIIPADIQQGVDSIITHQNQEEEEEVFWKAFIHEVIYNYTKFIQNS